MNGPVDAILSGNDPHNPENRAAGSANDVVKHAVYGAFLSTLLTHQPHDGGLRVHECHAGRGVYRITGQSSSSDAAMLARVGLTRDGWYAGSALRVATLLDGDTHEHIAYEWDPDTRQVLAATLDSFTASTVHARDSDERFDGESYIADALPRFDQRDVILLDPFGLWRRDKLAVRRARYRRIFERVDASPICIFFVWPSDELAEGHIDGSAPPVGDGYRSLLQLLDRQVLLVRWGCCAMWLWAGGLLDRLEEAVRQSAGAVRTARAGHGA